MEPTAGALVALMSQKKHIEGFFGDRNVKWDQILNVRTAGFWRLKTSVSVKVLVLLGDNAMQWKQG